MDQQRGSGGYSSLHSTPRTSLDIPSTHYKPSTSSYQTVKPILVVSQQDRDSVVYKMKRAFATHDENGQPRMNTYDAMIKPDGNCSIQ